MSKFNLPAAITVGLFILLGGSGTAQALDVNVGFVETVKIDQKVINVAVGDPAVAEATVIGKLVAVFGRSTGTTHVTPFDESGNVITSIPVRVSVYIRDSIYIDISNTTSQRRR